MERFNLQCASIKIGYVISRRLYACNQLAIAMLVTDIRFYLIAIFLMHTTSKYFPFSCLIFYLICSAAISENCCWNWRRFAKTAALSGLGADMIGTGTLEFLSASSANNSSCIFFCFATSCVSLNEKKWIEYI